MLGNWKTTAVGVGLLVLLGVFIESPDNRVPAPTSGGARVVRLKGTDATLALNLPAPAGAKIRVAAHARSEPGRIGFRISCTGEDVVTGRVDLARSQRFRSYVLAPAPDRCRERAVRLDLLLAGRGVVVDHAESETAAGRVTRVEAEADPGTALIVVDPDASAGLAVTTSQAGLPPVIRQRFEADRDQLSVVLLRYLPIRPEWREQIPVELWRVGAAEPLFNGELTRRAFDGDAYRIEFAPVADSAAATFEVILRPPGRIPISLREGFVDRHLLVVDGVTYAEAMPIVPLYRTPALVIAWIAFPVVFLCVVAGFHSEGASRWALALLVPAAAAISFAYWQRDYVLESRFEFQPDGYDALAILLRDLFRSPGPHTWDLLWRFLDGFPHAHNPLVATLAGGLAAVGVDLTGAFLLVAVAASAAGVWAVRWALQEVSGSWQVAWAGVSVYATHYLFLRSAARTCSDAAGLGLGAIALALAIVAASSRTTSAKKIGGIIAVSTAGAFARLSTLPVGPAIGFSWLLRDHPASSVFRAWPPIKLRYVLVAILPAVLLFGTIYVAGLGDSFRLAGEKLAAFEISRTPLRAAGCLGVLLQLTPLAFLLPPPPHVSSGALRTTNTFGIISLVAASALLVVSGAPFWVRHLAPALPGLAIATAPYLAGSLRGRILIAVTVLLNLGLVALNLSNATGIGTPHLIH